MGFQRTFLLVVFTLYHVCIRIISIFIRRLGDVTPPRVTYSTIKLAQSHLTAISNTRFTNFFAWYIMFLNYIRIMGSIRRLVNAAPLRVTYSTIKLAQSHLTAISKTRFTNFIAWYIMFQTSRFLDLCTPAFYWAVSIL